MICVDNKLFSQAEKLFVQSIVHEYIALYKIVNKYDLDINLHYMKTFMQFFVTVDNWFSELPNNFLVNFLDW